MTEVIEIEMGKPVMGPLDFHRMSTKELKQDIVRSEKEFLAGRMDRIVELCGRKDAGDLIPFFKDLALALTKDEESYVVKHNTATKVPNAVTGAVIGKSAQAVKDVTRKMPGKSRSVAKATETDKPDAPAKAAWCKLPDERREAIQNLAIEHGYGVSKPLDIASNLGAMAIAIRADDKTRAAAIDAMSESETNYVSIACSTTSAIEYIKEVEVRLSLLTKPEKYTLSNQDREHLRRVLAEALERLQ